MKKRVLVLGNLPLATKVLRMLQNRSDVELVGAIYPDLEEVYPSTDGELCAYTYCRAQNIPQLTIDDVRMLGNLDLAISARNNAILRKWFLDKFRIGVVNCHGGYLPEYKGVGGHIFPIINGEDHTGGSLHWMSDKVDVGDIIDREVVPIAADDTGTSLFALINDSLHLLIKRNLDRILAGTAPGVAQHTLTVNTRTGKSYFYFMKDLKRLIDTDKWTPVMRRALYWPGKPMKQL